MKGRYLEGAISVLDKGEKLIVGKERGGPLKNSTAARAQDMP